MTLRIQCLCIDANDPSSLATFWENVLGWRRTYENDAMVVLEPPKGSAEDGVAPDLLFLKVPEGKQAKNRVHLDVRAAPGLQGGDRMAALEARAEELVALGARVVGRVEPGGLDAGHVVLQDPEGNEFCLD